jgi:putative heme iron utilization protein
MESPVSASGHALAARLLIRSRDRAALGTRLAGDGRAYVSLVAAATDVDGSVLLLFSSLSDHTRNIAEDAAVSLLFEGTAGYANPQEGPRATVMGRAERVTGADLERVRRRYLASHPGAALYAGFADFGFFRVAPERIHWVGGFGKAAWIERRLTVEPSVAAAFAAAEPALLESLGAKADAVAHKRLGRRSAGWTLTALDPDGGVLARGKQALRFAFDAPLADPAQVAAALRRPPQSRGSA